MAFQLLGGMIEANDCNQAPDGRLDANSRPAKSRECRSHAAEVSDPASIGQVLGLVRERRNRYCPARIIGFLAREREWTSTWTRSPMCRRRASVACMRQSWSPPP